MLPTRNAGDVAMSHLLLTGPSPQPSPTGRGSRTVLPFRNESGAAMVRRNHLLLIEPSPQPSPTGRGCRTVLPFRNECSAAIVRVNYLLLTEPSPPAIPHRVREPCGALYSGYITLWGRSVLKSMNCRRGFYQYIWLLIPQPGC